MPRFETCMRCKGANSDMRRKFCWKCRKAMEATPPPTATSVSRRAPGALRPSVVRIPGETVRATLAKPVDTTGRLRFTLMGLVRVWELKEGQAMGVKVKAFEMDVAADQLILELEDA